MMKSCAGLLDAKPIGTLFIGLAGGEPKHQLNERIKRKARRLGRRLAKHNVAARIE